MGVCWGRFYGDGGITDLEIFKNPTSWPSPTGTWLISGFHSLWMLGFLIYDTKLRLLQSSHSVMSDSLRTPGPQHSRIPCPSPTLRAYSNSCPLSRWYHPTISSSVVRFSSHLQSFIRVFSSESVLHIRWPKYWSFSFSISPSNEYSGLISFRMD